MKVMKKPIFIAIGSGIMILITIAIVIGSIGLILGKIGGKEPPITNQTYLLVYINGNKDVITVKAHEGRPYINTYKGSYWLDLTYDVSTPLWYSVKASDGVINGVIQFKRLK